MAQPVTALLDPEPEDNRTMPNCPDFCDDSCPEWGDGDGGTHHFRDVGSITFAETYCGEQVRWSVSAGRTDEKWQAGTPDVNLHQSCGGAGATMTPAEARQLAALLLNGADLADPLPFGEMQVTAAKLRLDDVLLTDEGWQAVTGLMFFKRSAQVSVYTDERSDENTDGWEFEPGDPVRIRRRIHGSRILAFEGPQR